MKIHFLGTCAGTEPLPRRRHSAVILESGNNFYQFDAGESCAYTASVTMDLDLVKTRAIFVTHPHIDHIGGLPHLLFTLRKLCVVRKVDYPHEKVDVVFPDKNMWNAAYLVGTGGEYSREVYYTVNFLMTETADGKVFADENISVEALHNLHLGVPEDGRWRSFSYRIICENKTLIFSGDIKSIDDIAPFLADGCDALFIETGHHHPGSIAAEIKSRNFKVGKLIYVHSGRNILNDYCNSVKSIEDAWGKEFLVAEDAMSIEL